MMPAMIFFESGLCLMVSGLLLIWKGAAGCGWHRGRQSIVFTAAVFTDSKKTAQLLLPRRGLLSGLVSESLLYMDRLSSPGFRLEEAACYAAIEWLCTAVAAEPAGLAAGTAQESSDQTGSRE